MHAHDRHLARARSKAHTQDTRSDEARAYVRASRRAGALLPLARTADLYYRENGAVFGPLQIDAVADKIRVTSVAGIVTSAIAVVLGVGLFLAAFAVMGAGG